MRDETVQHISIGELTEASVMIRWDPIPEAQSYRVYWADADTPLMQYRLLAETTQHCYTLHKATHVPHFFKISFCKEGNESACSKVLQTPIGKVFQVQRERLNRGLVAVAVKQGIFLSWRLLLEEVNGYCDSGMTGADFWVYRNEERLALVTDSTNYLDRQGKQQDRYAVAPVIKGQELAACPPVQAWERDYLDIPIQKPKGGVTPAGEPYEYTANDMSVADVDGDGEYEYLLKWDPTNAHDVSIKGYTGKQYLDCYKLDGTLLWRLDLGVNIRAGAHYTQFMAYDFNGDGVAELAVKTAPGTKMTRFDTAGAVIEERYITMPQEDVKAGYSHESNFVCSAQDYRRHLTELFLHWQEQEEVVNGHWPASLEECFGIEARYAYPLTEDAAQELTTFFIEEYAPGRSEKNHLEQFEGFIYEGPEYLTMFAGNGQELETIPFKIGRVDDGLMWGDYALARIEPCNRSDRFLSGVAYLDGERPYLIICRGYYTRATIVAYDFFENRFHEVFCVDSGFVTMKNPFCDDTIHERSGSNPVYGSLAGQGNHSLAAADVDGDGCMEILYGAAVIDHDGSLLYSTFDKRPDGVTAKLGHGDAMHVARIDPDRPGLESFHVFEGGAAVPYGYALRDAETGKVIFGQYADCDLGRCMIGKIASDVRGLQVWVNEVYDCKGNRLESVPLPGTNQSIRFAPDLTTQITDTAEYIGTVQTGVISDVIHGVMLRPEGTLTNNGTKGNPCLIADIFGDFREEILLRTTDSSAIRIYMNTDITKHKLFTLMHDAQYRCGVAWQNNCYNQPCYPSFYYGSDMDFSYVLPQLRCK